MLSKCDILIQRCPLSFLKRWREVSVATEGLFELSWNQALAEAWNSRQDLHAGIAGAGTVVFTITDTGVAAILFWHNDGQMSVHDRLPPSSTPRFSAPLIHWREFITGCTSAVDSILDRKIQSKGDMNFVMRFGNHFDRVAEVARQMESERHK
jgi:putative sterol carrier protein